LKLYKIPSRRSLSYGVHGALSAVVQRFTPISQGTREIEAVDTQRVVPNKGLHIEKSQGAPELTRIESSMLRTDSEYFRKKIKPENFKTHQVEPSQSVYHKSIK
jgi:hypothetical protein